MNDADRDFVIRCLLSKARHESKKRDNARFKEGRLHPEVVKQIETNITECTRIADLLLKEEA